MKQLRISREERENFIKEITGLVERGNISQLKDLSGHLPKINEKEIKKPTVYVLAEVMLKMEALVKHSSVEISWHCLVKRDIETNSYLVYDILLFPQTNTGVTTSTDQEEYAKWLQDIMMDEDESKFDDMRMHGHSHVNMGVFSSGVDDGYQSDLLRNVKDGDFYIFMILNKKHDICTLIYDYEQQIMFENKDIDVRVVTDSKTDIATWANNQIKKFCKEPTYPRYNYSGRTYPYDYENNTPSKYPAKPTVTKDKPKHKYQKYVV